VEGDENKPDSDIMMSFIETSQDLSYTGPASVGLRPS
jgi:hypothetical protein